MDNSRHLLIALAPKRRMSILGLTFSERLFDARPMAPGLPVHISGPPHNVRLLSWGRAADGWWGLVCWDQQVIRGIEPETLPIAAWVPAQALSKPGWSSGDPVPRLALTGAQTRMAATFGLD